jgi:predicted metal-dependent phosphoesterase TrpH
LAYNTHAGIDLHIHSTASDGTFSPKQILDQAQDLSLAAIAITDHDTISGSKEALRIGPPPDVKFLTGVEISANPPASFPCSGSFHILGYAIDLDHPTLNQMLEELQQARKNRNPQILQKLKELGMSLSMDEIIAEVGEGQMGRPHIARVMITRGYAESINEVFDKYLGKGKPAYVDKYRLESNQAIELISNAGGIPVLAHPGLVEPTTDLPFENLLKILKPMGLKGIEIYYPEHSPEFVDEYTALADKYDLLMTGGTDFHGDLKPALKMGFGEGDFFVPYAVYEKLMETSSRSC